MLVNTKPEVVGPERPVVLYATEWQRWMWASVGLAMALRLAFVFITANQGTDAGARYHIAQELLKNPWQAPSEVWLPLHFWFLGLVLRMWNSELALRLATAVIGGLTLLPFWGLIRRAFDSRIAVVSSFCLAVFGIHIGYSVMTSSETLTIFLLTCTLYAWVRFRSGESARWAVLAGALLSAACLIRYEPWVLIPLLAALSFDDMRVWLPSNRVRLRGAVCFLASASAGALAWSLFSYAKWGDALASAHGTMWMNETSPTAMLQSPVYRSVVVPGALLASLGPMLAALAVAGLWKGLARPLSSKGALAAVAVVLAGTNYANAIVNYVTQARYTIIYSWLLIPFGVYAVCNLQRASHPRRLRHWLAATFLLFFVWQAAIAVAAEYTPCSIGDRLGRLSPMLPLRCDLRQLVSWMNAHPRGGAAIVDNVNYEAAEVQRFAHLSVAFVTPFVVNDPTPLEKHVAEFVRTQKPTVLVYSPHGQLGRIWSLPDTSDVTLQRAGIELKLHCLWQDEDYRVYAIEYPGPAASESR